MTFPSAIVTLFMSLSPIRHLEMICAQRARAPLCVSVNMLTLEFSARADRVEKWDAGKRTTERERERASFTSLAVP